MTKTKSKPGVYREGYGLKAWEEMLSSLEPFSSDIGKDVYVKHGGHEPTPVNTDEDKFYINFCAVPTGGVEKEDIIYTAYGSKLEPRQREGFSPSGLYPIIYDDHGVPLAELETNTLYILFNLSSVERYPCHVLTKILEAVRDYLSAPKDIKKKQTALKRALREQKELDIATSGAEYLTICQNKKRNQLSSEIEKVNKGCELLKSYLHAPQISYKNQLRMTLRCLETATKKLVKIEKEPLDLDKERTLTGFEAIRRFAGVEEVIARSGVVYVYTENITIEYDNEYDECAADGEYDIGKMKIIIDTEEGTISIINLTRTPDGSSHPHIEGGHVCFGNITDSVYALLYDQNIPELILLILQFLKTYTPGGAYVEIDEYWSIIEKEEKIK